jgi:hypothetical protein
MLQEAPRACYAWKATMLAQAIFLIHKQTGTAGYNCLTYSSTIVNHASALWLWLAGLVDKDHRSCIGIAPAHTSTQLTSAAHGGFFAEQDRRMLVHFMK